MEMIGALSLPLLLCLVAVLLLRARRNLFDAFLQGAKQGATTAFSLLPTLVALLVGITMMRASGVLDTLANLCANGCRAIGLPSELLPLVLIRPLSGGASTAIVSELFSQYGADSFIGRCASVMIGSSDTVFYIVAVYFGAVGIRYGRHTLLSALLTMLFSVFFSCFLCRLLF